MQLVENLPGTRWFGPTSDDRVVVLRDRGSDELYALDLEYRYFELRMIEFHGKETGRPGVSTPFYSRGVMLVGHGRAATQCSYFGCPRWGSLPVASGAAKRAAAMTLP